MSRRSRALVASSFSVLVVCCALLGASCASNDEAGTAPDGSTVVAAPDGGTIDAVADGGDCDARDPVCESYFPSCDEADFCPVPSAVDVRYGLTSVWGSRADDVWAVGSGGTIVHWNGSAWSAIPSNTQNTFTTVWGGIDDEVWIGGSVAVLLHGDGKGAWKSAPASTHGELHDSRVHTIWGTGAAGVWVGASPFSMFDPDNQISRYGMMLRRPLATPDAEWEVFDGIDGRWAGSTVQAIWGSAPNDVWIAIDDAVNHPWARGTLVHASAPAAGDPLTFTAVDSQSAAALESIWGSSSANVWAVGGYGGVRRLGTDPNRWEVVNVPSSKAIHGVAGSGPNDVWVVGDEGTIVHFDGTSWEEATVALPSNRRPNLSAVWCNGPDDVWAVGETFTLHFTGKKARK